MYRSEDDVEIAQAVPAQISPRRAALFALAGLFAAMLVLGVALAEN